MAPKRWINRRRPRAQGNHSLKSPISRVGNRLGLATMRSNRSIWARRSVMPNPRCVTTTRPRPERHCRSASPATGSLKKHNAEQSTLVNEALTGAWDDLAQPFSRATRLSQMGQ
jgi:hypothetical protein